MKLKSLFVPHFVQNRWPCVANTEKSRNWPKKYLTSKERERRKNCAIDFFSFNFFGYWPCFGRAGRLVLARWSNAFSFSYFIQSINVGFQCGRMTSYVVQHEIVFAPSQPLPVANLTFCSKIPSPLYRTSTHWHGL